MPAASAERSGDLTPEGGSAAGKAKYDSKKHALVWKIKRFTGATEHSLVSAVELIATTREKKSWSRPPISMTFQVLLAHL